MLLLICFIHLTLVVITERNLFRKQNKRVPSIEEVKINEPAESELEILVKNLEPKLASEIKQCFIEPDGIEIEELLGRGMLELSMDPKRCRPLSVWRGRAPGSQSIFIPLHTNFSPQHEPWKFYFLILFAYLLCMWHKNTLTNPRLYNL